VEDKADEGELQELEQEEAKRTSDLESENEVDSLKLSSAAGRADDAKTALCTGFVSATESHISRP
jgi:hypothetical protein